MNTPFLEIKALLKGEWKGEGYAKFPTIEDSAYTETWTFSPDEDQAAIHYDQKTKYKNTAANNGKTVFWDTGFILLKEEKILMVSAQIHGRTQTYTLDEYSAGRLVFNSLSTENDPKTIRSQWVITIREDSLQYDFNMSTHQALAFQNHLSATLERIDATALARPGKEVWLWQN
jgi:THAP4-like, heme-binding beta-barrel domain